MSKTKSKALSLMLVLSLFFTMVGFVNLDSAYAATKKIHLKKTSITLQVGKTYQQKLINKNGKTIKATSVKWKSSKSSVAKITKKGKIKAVKAGTAKMTAKYKGKTYKFTVKVKAPPHNKYIGVDQSSLSVDLGDTATVIVFTDNGEEIEYLCNNDNVDCEWGDWLDDSNDSYFYITGMKPGSSVVTVRDSYDKSIKATINVTVEGSYIELLQKYIDEKGYTTSSGYKEVDFTIDSNTTVSMMDHGDGIRFSNVVKYPDSNSSSMTAMELAVPESSNAEATVTVFIGTSYAMYETDVNMKTYNRNSTTLEFNQTAGSISDSDSMQKLCNSSFKLATTAWNLILVQNFGMTLNDLGFTSYK